MKNHKIEYVWIEEKIFDTNPKKFAKALSNFEGWESNDEKTVKQQ